MMDKKTHDKASVKSKSKDFKPVPQQVLKARMAVNSVDMNQKMDKTSLAAGGGVSGTTKVGHVGNDNASSAIIANSIHDSKPVVNDGVSLVNMQTVSAEQDTSRSDSRLQLDAVAQKRREMDELDIINRSNLESMQSVNSQKPKKGSFQITNVVNRKQQEVEDADSVGDDFDETNTEDLSSEIMDTSKITDIDQDASSADTVHSLVIDDSKSKTLPNPLPSDIGKSFHESGEIPLTIVQNIAIEPESGGTLIDQPAKISDDDFGATRFRIVKVSNERFIRGRWTAYDYQDSERTSREKSNEDLGSGNSSTASSVHYIPGVDDPTKNPFVTASGTVHSDTFMVPISESQLCHSSSQSQLVNGAEYPNTSAMVDVAIVTESSGAHNMPSSVAQSQAISSEVQSNMGYSGQMVNNPNTNLSMQPTDFVSSQQDYINHPVSVGQPTSQPQSIPQQSSGLQVQANLSMGTEALPENTAKSIPGSSPNNNTPTDFVHDVGSSIPSNNPNSDSQQTDFRQVENTYAQMSDDQLSSTSAEDDHLSEVGMARALMSQTGLTQPLLENLMVQGNMQQQGLEHESGASTVAIDNKIEQAMDLVKSHLMYAVREEVLVLKEQIKELIEKNNQLEYENNVLRSSASPETLSKLAQSGSGNTGLATQTSTS